MLVAYQINKEDYYNKRSIRQQNVLRFFLFILRIKQGRIKYNEKENENGKRNKIV